MKNKKRIIKRIVIWLGILFVLFSIVSFIVIKMIFDDIFSRPQKATYTAYLCYEDIQDEYEREFLFFTSGKHQLRGYLYGAENTKGLIVISHGLGGMAESYLTETVYFVEHGYQVFAFDNTGCDGSEGESSIGLCQSVIDLDAALTFIENEERFDDLPIFLYGHSWGGYAVTAIFNYEHDIAASVSVAGFNDPMTMITEWGVNMMGCFGYIQYPYIYVYQKTVFGKNLDMTAVDGINNTETPILLIHGNADETIRMDGAATVAYRDEITNPNVQYKICDKEKQNDHNRMWVDEEAISYIEEKNEIYMQLYEQYEEEIPDEVKAEFYAGVDKAKVNVLDENFMQDVLSFYEQSAGQ